MTRERAKELVPIITAYGEGKEIEGRNINNAPEWYRLAEAAWSDDWEYRIKPAPKMHPMTRGEVLYMVTTTPAMVTRCIDMDGYRPEYPASFTPFYDDDFALSDYEYAIIDKHGEPVDGWHKFEIEALE
jgi:hypothetical protein